MSVVMTSLQRETGAHLIHLARERRGIGMIALRGEHDLGEVVFHLDLRLHGEFDLIVLQLLRAGGGCAQCQQDQCSELQRSHDGLLFKQGANQSRNDPRHVSSYSSREGRGVNCGVAARSRSVLCTMIRNGQRPRHSSGKNSAVRTLRQRRPNSVGRIWRMSHCMSPFSSASRNGLSTTVSGSPVCCANSATGKPSFRRSAFSMNSKPASRRVKACVLAMRDSAAAISMYSRG